MSTLVSVIVATFNSSQFVVETLDSVLKQTWQDIELIITDDCSEDNTVNVCQKWLNDNKHRFINTLLLKSEKNSGVSGNANRGLLNAKGGWIKLLAADDTLKPSCIEDNFLWVESHLEIKVLFSEIEVYREKFEPHNLLETTPGDLNNPKNIIAPFKDAQSQYKMLLLCDRIHFSPSVFLHRETLLSLGGFDERFKLLEDYPLWLKLTKNGHKLWFMNKVTVNYRQHVKAINNTGRSYLINPNYFRAEEFRKIYTYPYLPVDIRLLQRYTWYVSQIFRINWLNKDKMPFRSLHSILTIWLNPFRYIIWLRKEFNKKLRTDEFYI